MNDNDIPSQEQLDAEIPRWQQRPKSYLTTLRAIHVWYISRRMGLPLTMQQAFEVVEDSASFRSNDHPSR